MMLSTCAGVRVSAPLLSFSLVFIEGGFCWAKLAALALTRINPTNANDLSRAIDNLIINPLVFLMLSGLAAACGFGDELYQRSTARLQSPQMSDLARAVAMPAAYTGFALW